MTAKKKVTIVSATVLAVTLACAAVLVHRIDQVRGEATIEEVLYLSSPQMVKRMSLGYTGLLADIYWTRTVQYFGGKHVKRSMQYQLLAPLLDITTELDPQLVVAYKFGSFFLAQDPPDGAGDPDKAVALVERGIARNPDDWQLYYHLGYIHYLEREDYAGAARAFDRGSTVPGAHPWMKIMAATMAQHGGDISTARFLWTKIYESTTDEQIKDNAVRRLQALAVDEMVPQLEERARLFREAQGRLPESWHDLIATGLLRRIPLDPHGHAYKLMPDGRVEVESPDDLPFIRFGLPPGKKSKQTYKDEPKK